ncbi:MAG: AraC family transcriptional regulator [Chryseobacterium sp.]|jgi:AraC-like DNA-binding protein|uniref:helix-turn-helix transcriptional regulator n=1 Tax=Chryseobacterium sp. TaxID=1871047 RepID=UPI00281F1B4D|nr:AraC family transcriptional regulator [Chryseobacterium sp.]MDR2237529.1 AraC family transcriptional regulator [Chryseobacterium sp.]
MKDQSDSGLVFSSGDIRIILYEDLRPETFLRSEMTESRKSFSLLFMLSPAIHLKASDCGTHFIFGKNQYILHYSPHESTAALWTEHQEALKYLQIQINYQYIFNLLDPGSSKENAAVLENMMSNNYLFLHKETPPDMTVEMHMILKEIIMYSKKGVMQKLFVEAKIIKLLMLVFEQFSEKDTVQNSSLISSTIRKFIDENYHKNIRAEEIGKLTGISQNRLRKTFKAQYHITVADYILELRMLKARKMIINENIMIKEIAIECGYEYVQNFTRAFKKKFGVSPENMRNGM